MKLLYVIEHFSVRAGLERIISDKMNALIARGHDVTLLTVWSEPIPFAYPLDSRIHTHCLGLREPRFRLLYPITLRRVLCRFNRFIHSEQPDVAIFSRAIGAWLAGRTSWQGRMVFESHGARRYSNHRWLYPRMERKVESVVCLTQGDAREYKTARRVEIIPNFTNIRPTGVPDYGAHRVVFVGRRDYQKNLERLHTLWERVQRTHPDWTLSLHHDTVDVAAAYQQGSIQVLTSRYEGFPMVLLEGQRCGLPCVAFNCPYGPADIIEDGVTGFLIPYNDDEAFVRRLTQLMDDEVLRRRMGQAAQEKIHRFDKEKILDQWERFLS